MNKKEYKKPSLKAIKIDSTALLAGSTKMGIINEEVTPYEGDESQKPEGYGEHW